MSEFVPITPEAETSAERFNWDNILRALATLSDISEEIDLYETIDSLHDETEEDAVMLIYNYAVMIEVPEEESSELKEIEELMQRYELIESSEGDDDEVQS